jgi:hypothetical protein
MPQALPFVPATFHLDGQAEETRVSFDAAPYLAQATLGELSDLADCGWGDDYAADAVAQWSAGASDQATTAGTLARLLEEAAQNQVGFTVTIDDTCAVEFLLDHRPEWLVEEVFDRVVAEDRVQDRMRPQPAPSRIGDLSPADIERHVASLLYNSDYLAQEFIDPAAAMIYRLVYTYGPDHLVVIMQGHVADALPAAAEQAPRADLYQAAGIPATEAWRMDQSDATRPTEQALRTLAGLNAGTA